MEFNIEKFRTFNNSKDSKVWDIGNNVLYHLCREFPKHKRVDEVVAKLWLIGRSYAAAIERRKNKAETNDRFYVKAAEMIIASDIDAQVARIPSSSELNLKDISIICEVHSFLTDLFYRITKLYKPSLASKYLHFHKPIVPILDSRSRKGIGSVFKGDVSCRVLLRDLKRKPKREIDERYNDYLAFVLKIQLLQKHIHNETGKIYSVREIDKYLLEKLEKV